MSDEKEQPTLTIRMLGGRQYELVYNGRVLDTLPYTKAFPIISGTVNKVELLARYGIQYEAG